MNTIKKVYWLSLLTFLVVMGYWVYRIWALISFELVDGEEHYLGNLMLYLLSWFLVFLIINLFAWFNFKYLFLRWRQSQMSGFVFWSVQLGILALLFEFLQWLSQHEQQIMKDNFMLTLVIALYFLAFTWFFDMVNSKRKQDKLIQQKDRAELILLQSQLNPHFLFNALNTSYSTAMSEDSPQTAQQILQISELMRFALEKSKLDFIRMEDEIKFLEKYIQVHKDRFFQKGKEELDIKVVWDGIDVPISPMLLQPLIENTFKFTHFGLGSEKAILGMEIKVEEGELTLLAKNSFTEKHVLENKGTGQGIELVKQRLKTIYPKRHELNIENDGKTFKVFLKINLND
jgi:LytS/YehU family sensor histidine kinase